jgi:ATP synthase protein I
MVDPSSEHPDKLSRQEEELLRQITVKERRRLRARHTEAEKIWFGLGTFGIIGWSVAVPTVLGILLGLWLDARLPGAFSWTVALLFAGVTLGCLNAWYWLNREREMIEQGRKNDNHG